MLDEAVRVGLVEKAGSWYAYGEERLGQGRDNSVAYLAENPDVLAELEEKVREMAGLGLVAPVAGGEEIGENEGESEEE